MIRLIIRRGWTSSEIEIGELIASAMERVGNEGVITVQVNLNSTVDTLVEFPHPIQ